MSPSRTYPRRLVLAAITAVTALAVTGTALAGPTSPVRFSDLAPATGSTVAAGQEVVVSGFIETDEGIGIVDDKPNVTVLIDGAAATPEFVVGSKAQNVGFRATRTFTTGSHTVTVTAHDYKGASASAETKFTAGATNEIANCRFILGFAELQREISDIAGRCVANEFTDPLTGDTLQLTTGPDGNGGMFVWRKADNFLAFTDGYRTWIRGPKGLERPRLNTERYPWEKERLTPKMLREGKYQLPIGQNDAEVSFKLVDGKVSFANPRWPEMPNAEVTLGNSSVWYGDFDGDGNRDAVVVLAVALGGSGEDLYAVPVRDVNGQAVQLGHELLGNRIKINGIALGTGVFRADIYTQGPNDVASNPTLRETKTFAVRLP